MPAVYQFLVLAALGVGAAALAWAFMLHDRLKSQDRQLRDLFQRVKSLQRDGLRRTDPRPADMGAVPPASKLDERKQQPKKQDSESRAEHLETESLPAHTDQPPVEKAALEEQSDEKHSPLAGLSGQRKASQFTPVADEPDSPSPPSLESIIGERWLNWVGVVTLLVGAALFLKYAYDNAWVGPLGRTLLAYVGGFVSIAAGAFARRRRHTVFADGVIALGFGVLYAATYFASAIYGFHWMTTQLAYGLMATTTAAGVGFAVLYRSQLLGFLTFLGGYLTPVLLSSGSDRGELLTIYLTLLAVGATGLGFWLRWRGVTVLALFSTYVLFLGWFIGHYSPGRLPLAISAIGAFFAIFTISSLLTPFIRREKSGPDAAGTLLTSSVVAFVFAYRILEPEHSTALVTLAVALAAFFGLACWRLGAVVSFRAPITIASLVLSMLFLTLAIPMHFELWGVPIAWAAEGVGFTYLARRFRSNWLSAGGLVTLSLASGSLLRHFETRIDETTLGSASFGTWAFHVVALFLSAWLGLRRLEPKQSPASGQQPESVAQSRGTVDLDTPLEGPSPRRIDLSSPLGLITHGLAGIFGFLLATTEFLGPVRHTWDLDSGARALLVALSFAVLPFVYAVPTRFTRGGIRTTQTAYSGVASLISSAAFLALYVTYQPSGPFVPVFHVWFLAIATPIAGAAALARFFRSQARGVAVPLLAFCLLGVFLLTSRECYQYFYQLKRGAGVGDSWSLTSLSVLWAVEAAGLMALGLARRSNALRWVALSLFGLTLAKVFLIDTNELEAVYRILAFVSLGMLLVAASFGYSRMAKRDQPDEG